MNGHHRIEYQEDNGDNEVIDTVYHKGMAVGTHVGNTLAVDDEGGDVPRHYKYTHGATEQEHTDETDLVEILGGKEQR